MEDWDVALGLLGIALFVWGFGPLTRFISRRNTKKQLSRVGNRLRPSLGKLVAQLQNPSNGIVPVVIARPPLLHTDEKLIACFPANLFENSTRYRSNSMSQLLTYEATHAPIVTSSGNITPIRELESVGAGRIAITTDRVLFVGDSVTREFPYRSIVDVSGNGEMLSLAVEGRGDREQFWVVCADLVAGAITAMVRRANS